MATIEKEREKIKRARYGVPYNIGSDDAIKRITGEALCRVDGVLGLKSGVSDILKKDEDLRRGITLLRGIATDYVTVHIITDRRYDKNAIRQEVEENILQSLRDGAGLNNVEVEVQIAEAISMEEFISRYGETKSCTYARYEE